MMPIRRVFSSDRIVFVLLGILSAVIVVAAYWAKPRVLVGMDMRAMDAMFAYRKPAPTPGDVAVVAVDERSVTELGRWPWTRKKTAALIRKLKGAKVVAIDMVYSEKESREADTDLSRAFAQAGNVVNGFFFRDDTTKVPDPQELDLLKKKSRISLVSSVGDWEATAQSVPAVEFAGVEMDIPVIGKNAAGFGTFNIIPQEDGIYREANLIYKFSGELYPNLALKALSRYLGGDIEVYAAPYGVDSIEINGRSIPLNEEGALTLNFYGPGGSFKTYSAVDVITGAVGPEKFKGKLVFLGVTEKAIYDIRPTPVDSLFPGVEILATIAGNVIDSRYLIRDTRVVLFDLVMIAALALVFSVVLSLVHSTVISLLVFAGVTVSVVFFDFYLFSSYNLRPGVIYPVLSLLLTYLSNEAYRNIVVEKKGRYLRKAFSTYVSPQLVTAIIKDPGRLKLGGEKRVITVLFSDIRGFTTLSEKLPPDELVTLLNEYLNPMTRIILGEEGTLDKYIGDAIMAIFNAPIEIPDHPKRSCAAAIGMLEKLNDLNNKWREKGVPTLQIGVGINTGEAVVGNMGAELRFDYTAIGDTVNLASRIEGMNKVYGTSMMVSEYTYNSAKGHFLFRELDSVRVKGKEHPIILYELLTANKGDAAAEELCADFSAALAMYRARRFEEAKVSFEKILEKHPDDVPSMLFIKRCVDCIESPPPEGWDGVFLAKTK